MMSRKNLLIFRELRSAAQFPHKSKGSAVHSLMLCIPDDFKRTAGSIQAEASESLLLYCNLMENLFALFNDSLSIKYNIALRVGNFLIVYRNSALLNKSASL